MYHSYTAAAVDLRSKLSRIESRQEQLKIAFHQLKSQIRTGLLEAEDVFASLAIPLMKLVGLKEDEMAGEGRCSSIIIKRNNFPHPNSQDWPSNRDNSENAWGSSMLGVRGADDNQRVRKLEEQDFTAKAGKVCKELMHKQQLQLMQLVQLLKQIEIQVNSGEDDILQTLADHRASLQKLFQKAVTYVYAIHQSHQNNDTSLDTIKLLKFTFDHVGSALGSVENGVEILISKLADKMCNPMVKYVNGLKAELVGGTCPSLLATVKQMEGTIRLQSLELEEARKKVKAIEESRLNALCKLKESEARLKEMMEHQNFTLEAHIQSRGHSVPEKLSFEEVDPAKDETLLWELLRKKRKLQVSDSTFEPKELFGIGTNTRNLAPTRLLPPRKCKATSTNHSARLSPRTPKMDIWIPLSSSPSTTGHEILPIKRIAPGPRVGAKANLRARG